MVASRQIEILYNRVVGRQTRRGFRALVQVFGRTTIPFLCNYVVPAAKHIVAEVFEFAAPEIGEVFSGRKSFKTAAKIVGKQTLRKQLNSDSQQRRIIPTNCIKQSSLSRRDIFLQTILVDLVKHQFSVPTFCGSVWKSWRESPNC